MNQSDLTEPLLFVIVANRWPYRTISYRLFAGHRGEMRSDFLVGRIRRPILPCVELTA